MTARSLPFEGLLCARHSSHACVKMYQEFGLYLGMVKPRGQEMIAIENIACYLWFPKQGPTPHRAGPLERDQGWSGGYRNGKAWAKALVGVFSGRNG